MTYDSTLIARHAFQIYSIFEIWFATKWPEVTRLIQHFDDISQVYFLWFIKKVPQTRRIVINYLILEYAGVRLYRLSHKKTSFDNPSQTDWKAESFDK